MDAIERNEQEDAGVKVILRPSVYTSPLWYAVHFQDSMAVVLALVKPDFKEDNTCSISPHESTAKLMRQCNVLVWDESLMHHRHVSEAMDRTFRDITKVDLPFGGITIVLAGDWWQILPVAPKRSQTCG